MQTTGALCRNQIQQLESEHSYLQRKEHLQCPSSGISSATNKSTSVFFSSTVLATLAPPDSSEKGGKRDVSGPKGSMSESDTDTKVIHIKEDGTEHHGMSDNHRLWQAWFLPTLMGLPSSHFPALL